MTKTEKKLKHKTDIKKLRELYNVSTKELCAELNISEGLYSSHELGFRVYKGQRYEDFLNEIEQALETITKRRLEKANFEASKPKNKKGVRIDLDDAIEKGIIYSFDDDDDDEELVFQPITSWVYEQAKIQLENQIKKNVVKVSIDLEICSNELTKKLIEDEKYYSMLKQKLADGTEMEEILKICGLDLEDWHKTLQFYEDTFPKLNLI